MLPVFPELLPSGHGDDHRDADLSIGFASNTQESGEAAGPVLQRAHLVAHDLYFYAACPNRSLEFLDLGVRNDRAQLQRRAGKHLDAVKPGLKGLVTGRRYTTLHDPHHVPERQKADHGGVQVTLMCRLLKLSEVAGVEVDD